MNDVGYVGSPFTWRHVMSVKTRRVARLNRALCSDEWRCMYPFATIRHLGHAHSDHCLILMEMNGVGTARLGGRPFNF